MTRATTTGVLALWLATCVMTSGCGGTSTTRNDASTDAGTDSAIDAAFVHPTSIPLDDLAAATLHYFCARLAQCYPQLMGQRPGFSAYCEVSYAVLVNETTREIARGIERGRIAYDPVAAARCLSESAALPCGEGGTSDEALCRQGVRGLVAVGAECAADVECEPAAYCRQNATCPATCAFKAAAGQACETTAECVAGASCVDERCRVRSGVGEACGEGNPDCHSELRCVLADPGTSAAGTCALPGSLTTAAQGEACDFWAGPWCAAGLACGNISGDNTDPDAVFECVPLVESGAACRFAWNDSCPLGEYCHARTGEDGTCRALHRVDEACGIVDGVVMPCANNFTCEPVSASSSNRTCRAFVTIGEPCVSDQHCASGRCVADVCVSSVGCN